MGEQQQIRERERESKDPHVSFITADPGEGS